MVQQEALYNIDLNRDEVLVLINAMNTLIMHMKQGEPWKVLRDIGLGGKRWEEAIYTLQKKVYDVQEAHNIKG